MGSSPLLPPNPARCLVMNVEKDDDVTVSRVLRFQATTLGYSFLLVLPIFGALAFMSSLDITDWGDGSPTAATTPPVVNEQLYVATVFPLMLVGWVTVCTSVTATIDPTFEPMSGPKIALWVWLPVMTISACALFLLFLVVPAWFGFEVHFYLMDIVGFVVIAVVSTVCGSLAGFNLGPRIQPEVYKRLSAEKARNGVVNAKNTDGQKANMVASIIFALSMTSVIVACKCWPSTHTFLDVWCEVS